MNHITLFKTEEEYKAAKDSLIIPNVSYISDIDKVEYMVKHIIDFGTDGTSKSMCTSRWDTDGDGEISFEEAAAVTNIGTIFSRAAVVDCMWLRYFKGLKTLNAEAFRYASSLVRIAIPATITSTGNNIMLNATSLSDVYLYWTTIPSYQVIGMGMFPNNIKNIYIPKGTKALYSAHARFSSYKSKLIELEVMP